MAIKRVLNWSPSPHDERDHLFASVAIPPSVVLPSKIDLSKLPFCPAVRDQGELGSCVGMSTTAALEFVERRQQNNFSRRYSGSALFAYYNARTDKAHDTGAYVRDSIKAMAKYGIGGVHYWSYHPSKFNIKPSENTYKDGLRWVIKDYLRLRTIQEIKIALAGGYPVVLGFECFGGIDMVGKDGVVPDPEEGERGVGGHAVCLVGYNEETGRFKFKNSWSKAWGERGYGYLSYKYVLTWSDDWWVIRR